MPIKRFDLQEELRATADRRKKADAGGPTLPSRESIPEMAKRLSFMFETLPQDSIQDVLSALFRANPSVSRAQLVDLAVSQLVQMSLADGGPRNIASFEPPILLDESPEATPVASSAAASSPISIEDSEPGHEVTDELLSALVAQVLALPDEALTQCVQTLFAILDRIAQDPSNDKVRRLRYANARFTAEVGRHEAAVDLLRVAGFEDKNEGGERVLLCSADPAAADSNFHRVREALVGLLQDLKATAPAAEPTLPRRPRSAAEEQRRERVAQLTEQRLRDPRAFRAKAEAHGAAVRASGGVIPRTSAPSRPAQPSRRAQHFTLSDVEKMRVAEEIANMPSYAEEYRTMRQGGSARDYSTMVARSYDPELIARQALDGTNRYRASKGLPPLKWHDGIARIAAQHAQQMASGAAPFSHDGFDRRVAAFPVAHSASGENLALNSGVASVADAAVDGWIKSPGHERNLVGRFSLCGIGAARSPDGTFYLTQLFALSW